VSRREGEAVHPNEESHRAILEAFSAGDLATAAGHYSDDVVFHINGRGSSAGDHHGFAAFVEIFSKMIGTVDSYSLEVHDVVAGDQHSVGLLTSTTTRGDRVLVADLVTVLTWRDGKVIDERIITADPYSADAFYT
jgi:ketosteroid isomerase-like protein